MFVRRKIIYGNPYYYLCETNRDSGKPRQRVLAFLGKQCTIEGALQALYTERWALERESTTPRVSKRLARVNARIAKLTALCAAGGRRW
jgi:hypothetical protein